MPSWDILGTWYCKNSAELHFSIEKKCKERSCVHIRKVYGLRGIKPWYTSRLIGTGCRCFKLEDWPFIILLTTYLEVQTYSTFFYRLQNVLPSHNFCQLSLYILLYRWWSQFYAMGCLGLKAKSMDWKYIQGERESERKRAFDYKSCPYKHGPHSTRVKFGCV